ncbi:MAG: hypothetical protein ACLQM8_14995 [Limisphaerales bacterium]
MNRFNIKTTAAMIAAAAVAAAIFVVQRAQMALLRAENQALVDEQENLRTVPEVPLTPTPGRELNLSPTTEDELSRLRDGVAQLTRDVEAAKGAASTNGWPTLQYSANVRVTVPWNQTVVTGGWLLPSGNRAFVLATPTREEDAARLRIETQIVELPQAAAERLGVDGPNAEEREVRYSVVFAADQVQALLKPLGDSAAARVLYGTASANVGMLSEIQLGTAGPVLDFIPIGNSSDGSGIELQLTAKLNVPLTRPGVALPPAPPGI